MIAFEDIQDYANKIAERFKPEKIILFGSYAYGQPTEDSDVDLLVVMEPDRRNWQKATEIRTSLGYSGFAMDLLVRRGSHVQKRLIENDPFYTEIVVKGKSLYEERH